MCFTTYEYIADIRRAQMSQWLKGLSHALEMSYTCLQLRSCAHCHMPRLLQRPAGRSAKLEGATYFTQNELTSLLQHILIFGLKNSNSQCRPHRGDRGHRLLHGE